MNGCTHAFTRSWHLARHVKLKHSPSVVGDASGTAHTAAAAAASSGGTVGGGGGSGGGNESGEISSGCAGDGGTFSSGSDSGEGGSVGTADAIGIPYP